MQHRVFPLHSALSIAAWGGVMISVVAIFLASWIPDIFAKLGFGLQGFIAILTGSLVVLFADFSLGIKSIQDYFAQGLNHCSLADALIRAAADRQIEILRISAISTAHILPILEATSTSIEKCIVMVPRFEDAPPDSREAQSNITVNEIVLRWQKMQSAGKIRNLSIVYRGKWPDHYFCIFDSDCMIYGWYQDGPGPFYGFGEPLLIYPSNPGLAKLIGKIMAWFDEAVQNASQVRTKNCP